MPALNFLLNIILSFTLTWGIYFFYLYPYKKLLYTQKTLSVSAYFACTFLVSYILFFGNLLRAISFVPFIILALLLIFIFIKHTNLTLRKKYLIVKIFEILYQQIFIYYLILFVLTYTTNYLYFGLAFGVLHSPILLIKYIGRMRFIYFILSFLGGYVFAYFTNEYIYGYYFSYLIHYAFYVLVAHSIPYRRLKLF